MSAPRGLPQVGGFSGRGAWAGSGKSGGARGRRFGGLPPNETTAVTAMRAAGSEPSLGALFPESIVEHFAQRGDNRLPCGGHAIGDLMQAAPN